MRSFKMPQVAANISAGNALKTAIDAKRSGVVLKTKSGDLRLVHYKSLVSAARNKTAIGEADYISILKVGGKKTLESQADTVKSAGLKFGYRGAKGAVANLLSVQATFAKRYLSASSGSRCTRPGKPANKPDRDWYHYYPPERRATKDPDICRQCGSKIL
jgi:hypothetical protein